jgi:hypothetical protein
LFNAVKTVLEQDKTVEKHLFAIRGVIANEKDDFDQKYFFGPSSGQKVSFKNPHFQHLYRF